MNEKDLNTLLSKFYNGDTTPAEEQLLRDNLPGDSLDKVLLDSLNELAQESFKVPDHLEQTLSESIDSWQQHEDVATSTTLLWWRRGAWWAVAASVAIAIVTGWWFMRNDNQASTSNTQQQLTAQVDTQAQELPVVQEAVSVPQVVEKEVVAHASMPLLAKCHIWPRMMTIMLSQQPKSAWRLRRLKNLPLLSTRALPHSTMQARPCKN